METSNRPVKKKIDLSILIIVIGLVIFGLVMVFSASYVSASYEHKGDSLFFLKKQMISTLIGFFGLYVTTHINYKVYRKYAYAIYSLNIFMLILTKYTPLGVEINQAKRWINLGIMNFQTSEFSKLATIIMTAYLINKYKNQMSNPKVILKILGYLIPTTFLIYKQPSYSAAMIVLIIGLTMVFIGGMSILHTVMIGVFGGIATYLMAMKKSYRAARLATFLDPFKNKTGSGWQIINSLYAISSGGLKGVGFGKSTQKYFYISQPQNDFIFAVIAEELGYISCIILILVFVYLIFRIFKLFTAQKDTFAAMVVAGIGIQIGIQFLLNIGVATASLPNTGVGLPFISYGGTSIMMFLIMVGILLNISKYRS